MHVIGLTGGIAMGKSCVSREWSAAPGVCVIDVDHEAHVLQRKGQPVYRSIVRTFGADVLDPVTGAIDRVALGKRVFGDEEARRRLNRLYRGPMRNRLCTCVVETF